MCLVPLLSECRHEISCKLSFVSSCRNENNSEYDLQSTVSTAIKDNSYEAECKAYRLKLGLFSEWLRKVAALFNYNPIHLYSTQKQIGNYYSQLSVKGSCGCLQFCQPEMLTYMVINPKIRTKGILLCFMLFMWEDIDWQL